ncbi:MAG: PQQ-like beta-propeller repeat protein [Sedimentisphaerales bacterium]|nr:PQQ-like beta-propeller repeat protein [Sedimentisphaerales bacterium]
MKKTSANKVRGVCVVLLVAAIAANAQVAEWYQWRGPERDAISTDSGLLKQWPSGGPELVWKTTGLGGGFSGVSLWADEIFTMGDKDDASYLIAVSRVDGTPLWSSKVGRAGGNDPQRPGPRCTPATDGTRVIALAQYGELLCADVATGRELWRKSYQDDFGATTVPRWNFSASPLLDGDRVICLPGGPKGAMVALDKESGVLIWQTAEVTDAASYSSIIDAEIGGVRQYIAVTDARVFGVRAEDGKLLWQAPREERNVIPTPVYRDGIVFISSGYNAGCHAFRITVDGGAFKTEPIYDNPRIANQHGGSILVGDHIYVSVDSGGRLTCLEFATGDIVWQDASVGKASLGYADGHLIVRSENGPVALVEATPAGYREKGRFDQPNRSDYNSWPHPVVAGGRLYLRDHDVLLCYELNASAASR